MNSLFGSMVLFLLGGLSACTSPIHVTTDYDHAVNFAKLESWSFYPTAGAPHSDPEGIVSLTESRVRAALESDLLAHGYPQASNGASFLVAFHAVLQQKIEGGAEPYGYLWRRGYMGVASAPDVMIYEEGTLLIDFIDPQSKTMIWRGTASEVVDPTSSVEKREGAIHEAVSRILEEFPPRKQ